MKTAVSVPNEVYAQAEELAQRTGRTRSESQPIKKTVKLARSSRTTDQVKRLMHSFITDAR